jgi:hypothetical protein
MPNMTSNYAISKGLARFARLLEMNSVQRASCDFAKQAHEITGDDLADDAIRLTAFEHRGARSVPLGFLMGAA